MKAVRVNEFGNPEVLKVQDVPDPKPDSGQVLIRVKAVGVNPVDTYIRAGVYPRKPNLPYTPGTDASGTVEAVGPNVKRFKAGDRVYTSQTITGGYAQLTVAEESRVHPLPSNISFQQGAALGIPYGTAFRALFQRAKVKPGETLLVHGGSGGVGTAAIQLARAFGMTVIGTAGTEKGLKLVTAQGAHHAADHRTPDYEKQIMNFTGGRGVDVIAEMLANVNLAKDLTLLAPTGGRIVIIGNRGSIEINPRDAMMREATILGMTMWLAGPADVAEIHAALYAGLENGSLRPVIGHELPISEVIRSHQQVLEPGAYGKIVLLP